MEKNFDTARTETEEMFNDNQLSLEDAQITEETPPGMEEPSADGTGSVVEPQQEQRVVLNDAVQTAETAAQVAAEKDVQLQQAMQQIDMLKSENSRMQGTIEEMSRQNQQQVVEEALEPPTIDVGALAFADDETVREAQAKYAADMATYNRNQIMKELSPFVEQAKEGLYEKEKNEVIAALAQIPELSGIENMVPQLENIIKNNRALSVEEVPLDEKLITAYAIAKGVNAINTPPQEQKEPTVDELMDLYNNNPAFQEMVEKQRLEQIKQSQQVPPFSASSGAVNAALNIKEKPKTFEEASKRTREMFGMN